MIITKNSDIEKLYGSKKTVYKISEINGDFDSFDELEALLATHSTNLSEAETSYMLVMSMVMVNIGGDIDDPELILSDQAARVFATIINELDELSIDAPFVMTASSTVAPKLGDDYIYVINLDGTGSYNNSKVYAFLTLVLNKLDELIFYPEVFNALHSGLKNKLGVSANVPVTLKLPSRADARIVYNGMNTAVAEYATNGGNSAIFFAEGEFDDYPD